jgi:hypothetical protein
LEEIKLLKSNISNFNKRSIRNLASKLKTAYSQVTSQNDIILGQLYDEAIKSYDSIIDYDKNTCILCTTNNLGRRHNSFYDQINNKIKSYKKFKDKYTAYFNKLKQKIDSSRIIDIEKRYLNETDRFFTNILDKKEYSENNFFELNNIEEITINYKKKIISDINENKNRLKELKAQIPPKISELIEIHNTYKFIFHSIVEINKYEKENNYNTKFLIELENWRTFAESIKEEYEEGFNILMDEIANSIDRDTKIFFTEIMGNVEIKPKIIKEFKGQKVNIVLENFYSNRTNIKAATVLSESYSNALCLSIYFAAALMSRNPGNFIIVDDITSSFDSGHQLFLLELIKNKIAINPKNKKGKQIILLTHDGLLKKILNENNNLSYWKHYNLNATRDMISLKPFKSEDLKQIIQNNIANGYYSGSSLRMYYEFVLQEIIENINLEIPYSLINNNDEKMVNKLLLAISEIIDLKRNSKKINHSLNIPNKCEFKTYIQQMTNNLSHWSSASVQSLTAAALNKIVEDIDIFKRRFQYNCTCSKNAGWIYFKSLYSPKHKGCTCTL